MKLINETLYDAIKRSLKLSERGEVCSIHRVGIATVILVEKSLNYSHYIELVAESNDRVRDEDRFAREIYRLPVKVEDLDKKMDRILEILERIDLRS